MHMSPQCHRTYASEVRNLLFSYEYSFIWLSLDIVLRYRWFYQRFQSKSKDVLQQEQHDTLISSSETQLYSQFKLLLDVEKYISFNFPLYLWQVFFSKFRCSDHKLNIEVRRHHNIPKDERICTFCFDRSSVSVTEDEFHVFLECKKYEYYRKLYIGRKSRYNTDFFFKLYLPRQ